MAAEQLLTNLSYLLIDGRKAELELVLQGMFQNSLHTRYLKMPI